MKNFLSSTYPLLQLYRLLGLGGWLLGAGAGLGACTAEELPAPALPAPTHTGANTVGCKVNGHNWVAASGGLFSGGTFSGQHKVARIDNHNGIRSFSLWAKNMGDEDNPFYQTSVTLTISNLRRPGTYVLSDDSQPDSNCRCPSSGKFRDSKSYSAATYRTSVTHHGQLTITHLDTVRHIVAGTFEFNARKEHGTETVKITDGRFDMQYK